jgi:hypothetical protein
MLFIFFNTSVNKTPVAAEDSCFRALVSFTCFSVARYEHSSLVCLNVSDEEKRFYNFESRKLREGTKKR